MTLRQLLDHHNHQVNRKAWDDLRGFSDTLKDADQLKIVNQAVSPRL